MSSKAILLLVVNIAILVLLIKIIFKTGKEFFKAIKYYFYPDIVSMLKKDFNNDFNYTHKLILLILVMIIVVFAEYALFYYK